MALLAPPGYAYALPPPRKFSAYATDPHPQSINLLREIDQQHSCFLRKIKIEAISLWEFYKKYWVNYTSIALNKT